MSTEKEGLNINTVASLIAIGGFILVLAKFLLPDEEEKRDEAADKDREKDYDKIKPSFKDYVYNDLAEMIDGAIRLGATEDEETVYAVFRKMKNISDVNKLIQAYGRRRALFTLNYVPLPQAISTLFSPGEKEELNKILSDRKIDYTFE